jgi:hypothetical protein
MANCGLISRQIGLLQTGVATYLGVTAADTNSHPRNRTANALLCHEHSL